MSQKSLTRKHVYIVNTSDIAPFEAIAHRKVKNAPNWQATALGLYVEVDLSSDQCSRIKALSSVSIFDERQHVITDQDKKVLETMEWSKMTVKVFFSYSHIDEALRDQLEVHLTALKLQGQIDTWHDRRITPGDNIDNKISAELEDAKIILLLISPDFIASDYCYGVESIRALERHEANEARVIPVVLRPCDWSELPFGKLLALPTDGKPITRWANIDEAFLDVVQGVKRALTELGTAKTERPVALRRTMLHATSSPIAHSGPRSSNLRIAKSFSEQDRDDFLYEAFAYLVKFFENSLDELSKRNPGVEGRFRRSGENRFTAMIYRDGSRASTCTVFIDKELRGSEKSICIFDDELDSNHLVQMNESLSVGHDEQTLFLEPIGMPGFSNQEHTKLSMQGGAELFWGAFIQPLQERQATRRHF